ncbi:MAG: serine hydrolase [Ignavibacteriae bacterium]|nr:serine hydrolase [Ignavibacteriota bacterium]
MRVAVLIVVSFGIATGIVRAQYVGIDAAGAAQVEETVADWMQRSRTVGCSVGLVKAGRIVYLNGFGYRDLVLRIPATEYTMYRTASVAKPFTAVLALQLAEEQRLQLAADVRTLVPEYPAKPQGMIKIGHLLTHRSGIRNYDELDSTAMRAYEPAHRAYNALDALSIFRNGSLSFVPGTSYQYSTFGFNLLGAAIERASGVPYQELLETRIRRRLALPYLQPEVAVLRPYPGEAKGYHLLSNTPYETKDDVGILYKVPGGGLICTVVDLCGFMNGLMGGRLYDSAGTLEIMGTVMSPEASMGLGMFVASHNGNRTLHHAGGQLKTSTYIICEPATGNGVAVMTNTLQAPATALGNTLLDLLASLQPEGPEYTPPPDTLPAPLLHLPAQDDIVQTSTARLQWGDVAFADRYIVQIDTTAQFTVARSDTVRTTESLRASLRLGATYHWRVKALNPFLYRGVQGAWSNTGRFRAADPTHAEQFPTEADVEWPRVFPNPARGLITVEIPQHGHVGAFTLSTIDGRITRRWHVEGSSPQQLDLHGIAPGYYIIRAEGSTRWAGVLLR